MADTWKCTNPECAYEMPIYKNDRTKFANDPAYAGGYKCPKCKGRMEEVKPIVDTTVVKTFLDEAHRTALWRVSRNIRRIECIRVLPGSLVYTKVEGNEWGPKERTMASENVEAWREGAFFVWVRAYGEIGADGIAGPATLCQVAIKSKFVRRGWGS